MTLDLCIPTFNEADVIRPSILKLRDVLNRVPGLSWRILVADNGSTDSTAEIVRMMEQPNVEVIVIPERGKGRAVRIASRLSSADLFGFIDADLSCDPNVIPAMLLELITSDVVTGSRLLDPKTVRRGTLRTLSSRAFNVACEQILKIPVRDVQCGMKVMNARARAILAEGKEDGWFFDAEFLAASASRGLKIKELPVAWDEFPYPNRTSKLSMGTGALQVLPALLRIKKRLRALSS